MIIYLRYWYLIFLIAIILSGCGSISPIFLGLSEEEWSRYSDDEKDLIRNSYKQIKLGGKTDGFFIEEDNVSRKDKGAFRDSSFLISIFGGEVIVPPFIDWVSYYPIEFIVVSGECKDNLLREVGGVREIELRVCYFGNVLFIDPSRFDLKKRLGSAIFYYSPLWEEGFLYRKIDTSGYVRFREVNVEIKKVDEKPVN